LRKLAAAALALPVLATLYVPILLRRSVAFRVALGLGVAGLLGLGFLALSGPRGTAASVPPSSAPLDTSSFAETVQPDRGLHAPATITFAAAMNPASVAAALTVDPTTPVTTSWDTAGRTLTISPQRMWTPATYYTIKVGTSARDTSGHTLTQAARALFTTRAATTARLSITKPVSGGASPATGFTISFSGQVSAPSADSLLAISPAVSGSLVDATTGTGGSSVTFQPDQPLAPDTTYTVALQSGVLDADGSSVAQPQPLSVTTALAPAIVRFRPLNGTTGVTSSARLSVRFTQAMDPKVSGPAFSATVAGKVLAGKVSWAEGNTVLVFTPAKPLTAGAIVQMAVSAAAQSATGVGLVKAGSVSFRTAPSLAPAAKASVPKATKVKAKPKPTPTGGSSVGAGAWHAVEVYYLGLMNCTRGGGWVLASGKCSSPGGSGIKPLILNAGISNKVSRPYARFLAQKNICSHFAEGTPGDRLHKAGYPGDYRENIGCRPAKNPYASVLGTHIFFQDEKPCGNYCHWANIMDPRMTEVGIGVWVIGDRVRLVVDFWTP
jgi:Bacterial Ig-like domain